MGVIIIENGRFLALGSAKNVSNFYKESEIFFTIKNKHKIKDIKLIILIFVSLSKNIGIFDDFGPRVHIQHGLIFWIQIFRNVMAYVI